MGRYHVVTTLLPCLAASLVRAQTSDATQYTPEQYNSWVSDLVASDGDASNMKIPDEMGFGEPVREMCIFQRTKPKMFMLTYSTVV